MNLRLAAAMVAMTRLFAAPTAVSAQDASPASR